MLCAIVSGTGLQIGFSTYAADVGRTVAKNLKAILKTIRMINYTIWKWIKVGIFVRPSPMIDWFQIRI